MSYNIRLSVVNGTAVLDEQTGTVPDGQFIISGHEGQSQLTLAITKSDGTGDVPITASIAMPAVPAAPADAPTPAPPATSG